MRTLHLPYATTGRFAQVVLDYLEGAPQLDGLYTWPMDADSIRAAARVRPFAPEARERLMATLQRQYAELPIHPEVAKNLEQLARPGTVTVTTGHQLCLFTGPLYVPLKIMNTVRLARDLSTAVHPIVPVFWMATEDHDRAEIDHAWFREHKLAWPGPPAGAVGRMPLNGIEAVLAELDPLLGHGTRADELRTLLRDAYRPERTLAEATRRFVNALFGRFGVLVLDGDDPGLKAAFAPVMREELLHAPTAAAVATTRDRLVAYGEQAHARPINLFHLGDQDRVRIERTPTGFRTSEHGPLRSEAEVLQELEAHPEHFSPNVLLRPLYQETVLPNVAYVGGGGEVAYWLQLRPVFDHFGVPMPAVVLRTSVAWLNEKDARRAEALGLSLTDLFAPLDELRARVARDHATFNTSLQAERERASAFYAAIAERAQAADPTLLGTAQAMSKRAARDLERMENKLVRAAKREQQDRLAQLERVRTSLFPGGGLQERRDNFKPSYLEHGTGLFDLFLDALDPLAKQFTLWVDDAVPVLH